MTRFIVAATFALAVTFALAAAATGQSTGRYEFERELMGTKFRIVAYATDSLRIASAVRAAFVRVDSLNRILSDYLPDSELSRLSARSGTGDFVPVSDDLWHVVARAQKLAHQTNGAFDVTVGPLTRIWRHAMRRQSLPDSTALEEAGASVGYRFVEMDSTGQRIRLTKKGMRLDLGGIAKGYAVDQAFEILLEAGLDRVLVDGGGDLRLGIQPPGRAGWEIAVTRVDSTGHRGRQILVLSDVAIATSGATFRYLESGGVRYSHIVDPETGLGLTQDREVTVLAPTCMPADALSTVLSILGRQEGRDLIRRNPEIRVRFVERSENGYLMTDIPTELPP